MNKLNWTVRGWLYKKLQVLSISLAPVEVRDMHNRCMAAGISEYEKTYEV